MKKRWWFRIHLSTALVMMLVAGGLMGANFMLREHPYGRVILQYMGWPFDTRIGIRFLDKRIAEKWDELTAAEVRDVLESAEMKLFNEQGDRIYGLARARFIGNIGFGLVVLAGVYFLLEWRLWRKKNDS